MEDLAGGDGDEDEEKVWGISILRLHSDCRLSAFDRPKSLFQ